IDRYRRWQAQHPGSERYLRFDGGLKWAAPGESLRETFEHERSRGYDAVWLNRSEIAERLPDVRPQAVHEEGAVFNPGEGWIDLPHIIPELVAEAVAGGATVLERVGPVAVERNDDDV